MHLLICSNVSVLHELVATGMRPVHPPTNIPPHCPQTNTLIRIGYVRFLSFVTCTFGGVVAGPTCMAHTTHNPPVATTSPPLRASSRTTRDDQPSLSFLKKNLFLCLLQTRGLVLAAHVTKLPLPSHTTSSVCQRTAHATLKPLCHHICHREFHSQLEPP